MKITVNKIQRELAKKYGGIASDTELIKEVLKIVDEQLIRHKNISILNTIKPKL